MSIPQSPDCAVHIYNVQGTSDPQWSLSLRKRAMGGEDQSIECQLKPANNSLACCYVISKERCVSFCDDLMWVPVLKIETWQRTWENYIFKFQAKFHLVLRQNDTLLWQLHNFRDSSPSNPQIVSNHFKSSEKPNLDLLGCLTQAHGPSCASLRLMSLSEAVKKVQVLSDLLSVHEQPGLLVILAVAHTFSHEEHQVDFAADRKEGSLAVHLAVLKWPRTPFFLWSNIRNRGTHTPRTSRLLNLEVLRVGVPGFLIFDHRKNGVRGYDFRFNMKTKTFGTQKPQNRLLHRGPVLRPCRCQNSGAAGGALSSSVTARAKHKQQRPSDSDSVVSHKGRAGHNDLVGSLWPARPFGAASFAHGRLRITDVWKCFIVWNLFSSLAVGLKGMQASFSPIISDKNWIIGF